MQTEPREDIFDTALYAKVTAQAKERLSVLKAALIRAGFQASEQTILTALILMADTASLESHHERKTSRKTTRKRTSRQR